jgi:hypothetical protein
MSSRLLALFFIVVSALPAAKKSVATAKGENEDLVVTATLYIDGADIKELVGSDLGGYYYVADIKVEPKYGKEVNVLRDDFLLRNLDTGEKGTPYAPSQIAGKGAIVVSHNQEGKPSKVRPTIGIGGMGGGMGSGTGDNPGDIKTTVKDSAEKDTALEKTLTEKMLPEKKTDQPVSGLLYFIMEKTKMKNLELDYGGKENRITLRFNK